MKEKMKIAIGLQMESSYAQVTCCNPTMKEPVTLEIPGAPEDDPYRIEMPDGVWDAVCGRGKSIELARDFFRDCLMNVCASDDFSGVRIMITVPRLDRLLAQRLPQALMLLGVERKNIYLQDYLSGFFFYTINQRKELWARDVALLEYKNETMIGYVLNIDWTKSPAIAKIERVGIQPVDEKARDGRGDAAWDRERDRLFFEFLKKVFERRNVISCYLMGDYFSRDWAERSFQYLVQGRHAFQGKNLYSKGACYAAMERCGMIRSRDILFMGDDIVSENFSIQMRVRGKLTNYPLISAGINWYEAHHECEFIVNDEKSITILTKPMTGGTDVSHILRMDAFPNRPPRATRLRLLLYFISPDCCCMEVEDLGFGGFYRSGGQKWTRRIYL